MEDAIGRENALVAFSAFEEPASVAVRYNPSKNAERMAGEVVKWSSYGVLLDERPVFTLDPCFHAGAYYVQDSSSMFVGEVFRQCLESMAVPAVRPVRVLDLCAAPGGKTTDLAASLREKFGDGFVLVANEVMKARVGILADNVALWGDPNVVVTSDDPSAFASLPGYFDIILADVPCSGEGMFRKDEGAIAEWSEENVEACAIRQRKILQDVWAALRPGGVLIYSTCTFNHMENEENVQWIAETLGAKVLPVAVDPSWGIVEGNPGYHFYPHKTRGEGFYICALQKHQEDISGHIRPLDKRLPKFKPQPNQPVEQIAVLKTWLKHPDHWVMRQQDRFIVAYPAKYKDLIHILSKQFICISTGFGICELRGKAPVPQHALAMLKDVNMNAFHKAELTLEQALSYLRNEALTLPNAATGIVMVTYENVPLGFVKNVGNHCNNLYPKEWRIRKL